MSELKEKVNVLVQFPLQSKYCITGETLKFYMTPINENLANEIDSIEDPNFQFKIDDRIVKKKDIVCIIGECQDLSDVPNDIKGNLKKLFDEKNYNYKPSHYDNETRIGSNNLTICNTYIEHYKYGLSCIGNPENIIIFKSF